MTQAPIKQWKFPMANQPTMEALVSLPVHLIEQAKYDYKQLSETAVRLKCDEVTKRHVYTITKTLMALLLPCETLHWDVCETFLTYAPSGLVFAHDQFAAVLKMLSNALTSLQQFTVTLPADTFLTSQPEVAVAFLNAVFPGAHELTFVMSPLSADDLSVRRKVPNGRAEPFKLVNTFPLSALRCYRLSALTLVKLQGTLYFNMGGDVEQDVPARIHLRALTIGASAVSFGRDTEADDTYAPLNPRQFHSLVSLTLTSPNVMTNTEFADALRTAYVSRPPYATPTDTSIEQHAEAMNTAEQDAASARRRVERGVSSVVMGADLPLAPHLTELYLRNCLTLPNLAKLYPQLTKLTLYQLLDPRALVDAGLQKLLPLRHCTIHTHPYLQCHPVFARGSLSVRALPATRDELREYGNDTKAMNRCSETTPIDEGVTHLTLLFQTTEDMITLSASAQKGYLSTLKRKDLRTPSSMSLWRLHPSMRVKSTATYADRQVSVLDMDSQCIERATESALTLFERMEYVYCMHGIIQFAYKLNRTVDANSIETLPVHHMQVSVDTSSNTISIGCAWDLPNFTGLLGKLCVAVTYLQNDTFDVSYITLPQCAPEMRSLTVSAGMKIEAERPERVCFPRLEVINDHVISFVEPFTRSLGNVGDIREMLADLMMYTSRTLRPRISIWSLHSQDNATRDLKSDDIRTSGTIDPAIQTLLNRLPDGVTVVPTWPLSSVARSPTWVLPLGKNHLPILRRITLVQVRKIVDTSIDRVSCAMAPTFEHAQLCGAYHPSLIQRHGSGAPAYALGNLTLSRALVEWPDASATSADGVAVFPAEFEDTAVYFEDSWERTYRDFDTCHDDSYCQFALFVFGSLTPRNDFLVYGRLSWMQQPRKENAASMDSFHFLSGPQPLLANVELLAMYIREIVQAQHVRHICFDRPTFAQLATRPRYLRTFATGLKWPELKSLPECKDPSSWHLTMQTLAQLIEFVMASKRGTPGRKPSKPSPTSAAAAAAIPTTVDPMALMACQRFVWTRGEAPIYVHDNTLPNTTRERNQWCVDGRGSGITAATTTTAARTASPVKGGSPAKRGKKRAASTAAPDSTVDHMNQGAVEAEDMITDAPLRLREDVLQPPPIPLPLPLPAAKRVDTGASKAVKTDTSEAEADATNAGASADADADVADEEIEDVCF